MAGSGQYIEIVVNGETLRLREIVFVIFNPEGKAVDFLVSTPAIRDNIARAARTYFVGDTAAIEQLNDGWHIECMSKDDMRAKHGADLFG